MNRIAILPALIVSLITLVLATCADARPTVLFDQGHGQRFAIERDGDLELSHIATLFRESGYDVASTDSPLTGSLLGSTDALVISGTFKPYAPEEIEAIAAFVDRGGALCIMLHIAPPLSPLLERLGVDHSNGVIHEQENIIDSNPINFQVTLMANHPLFQGIRHFSVYGIWALRSLTPAVQAIAVTSPAAWIDMNRNGRFDPSDPRQSFAVVVVGHSGNGRYVIFGDDAIFQNKFLTGDNATLGRNLAAWLAARHSPPFCAPQSP